MGTQKPQACKDKYKNAHEDCELRDLDFVGDTSTWRNNDPIVVATQKVWLGSDVEGH